MIYLNKTYLGILVGKDLVSGTVNQMKLLVKGKKINEKQKEIITNLDEASKYLNACVVNIERLDAMASRLQKENVTLQLSMLEQSKQIEKLKAEINELKDLL
jgi:peptidoglycan hydrolase CwlO-like protein